MDRVTVAVLTVAALALFALSGCTVVSDGDGAGTGTNATAVADRVEQTLNDTDTLEATLIATTQLGNETITERVRLRYKRPQHYNLTWLSVTNGTGDPVPNTTGDAILANGSQLWAYDDARGTVTWLNATRPRTLSELLMPSTQFGQNVTFAGNATIAGSAAVKLSYAIDGSKLSLIAGETNRQSRLASSMNASTPVNATVWIDRERWLPIKSRLTISAFDENVTAVYRYEGIERNVDIPPASFNLPEDATRATPWQALEDRFGEHQSAAAVAEEATAPLSEPTLPEGFGFEWGNVTTLNGTERIILFYGNGETKLQVTRWDSPSIDPLNHGESVRIGATNGTFVSLSQARYVEWLCDDHTYLISTRAGRETALSVARSIGC